MEYRTIPHTTIRVPVICLGTMTWGRQNSEQEAHEQLDYALAHGVNFFDTAEMYPIPPEKELQGTTERFIGSWIEKHGKRDAFVLASKVGASNLIQTRAYSGARTIYDRTNIRAAVEGSLSRLRTDYLDLYQVHWPERKTNFFGPRGYEHDPADVSTPIEETLGALDELVREGKIRAIGVSNETPWGISEYLRASEKNGYAHISTIQNQYSLINRTFEIGLAEMCIKEQIGLLAYSPLSMGVLTGKYLHGARPAGARFTLFERNQGRYNTEISQPAVEAYVAVAKKHGLDPAAMALAFIAMQPFTTSVIIGATSIEQLSVDIEAGNLTLSAEVLADIRAVYERYPDPTA